MCYRGGSKTCKTYQLDVSTQGRRVNLSIYTALCFLHWARDALKEPGQKCPRELEEQIEDEKWNWLLVSFLRNKNTYTNILMYYRYSAI
jgi:hypothetical protein